MSSSEIFEKYMERQRVEGKLRSEVEERRAKSLDPLLAHTKGAQAGLSGLRNWWGWLWIVANSDPPCPRLAKIAEYKVMTLEWDMSAGVASADVFHDPEQERNQQLLYGGGGGQDLGGLDDL